MSVNVALGSTNANKVEATKIAFARQWPAWNVVILQDDCDSGVAAQPVTKHQIKQGAHNRCHQAATRYAGAAYSVGIEGGVYRDGRNVFETTVFHVLCLLTGVEVHGFGPSVPVADGLAELLDVGLDLNEAIERITGIPEIGKHQGFYGLMSQGTASRVDTYALSLTLILGRFTHPELD